MSNDDPTSPSVAWSWRPTMSARLRRNVMIASILLAVAIAVSVGVAIASPGRFVLVVSALLVGIGVLWFLEHRRFRATVVTVHRDGLLQVSDGRQSGSIRLSTVDSVDVRLRTQPGVSVIASTPRWTIELAGPDAVLTHAIAHAGGLFNPAVADVERLRADLASEVERHDRHGVASGPNSPRPATTTSAIGTQSPSSAAGVDESPDPLLGVTGASARFEWRPPLSPNARRNRRIFRSCYVGAALLVAVLGVVSAWGDWVGVVLSALTVPGLIVLCCGGLDWAITRNRRFRIVVERGSLHVEPAGRRVSLTGASVTVDRRSHLVATSTTTTRGTNWVLSIDAVDGSNLTQVLPGFGTASTEQDYVALERELRRRT